MGGFIIDYLYLRRLGVLVFWGDLGAMAVFFTQKTKNL